MKSSKPTIQDVAEIAGVSAITVSRVLNGKAGVGDTTRAKIHSIIKDVGYHPNLGARALRGVKMGCIGVTTFSPVEVIPLSESSVIWLFSELYRVFGIRGERICFDLNPHNESNNGDFARSVWEQLFAACIIVGPIKNNDKLMERIHHSGLPYLTIGHLDSLPECSKATVNYEHGSYIATKKLIEAGHSSIALLRSFDQFQPGEDRLRGYLRALNEHNIEPQEHLNRSMTFSLKDNAETIREVLSDSTVTGLVDSSSTDDASILRKGAQLAGRTIGKDVDIVLWTYSNTIPVLPEALAHVWIPVFDAITQGLEELSKWYYGQAKGPVSVRLDPLLYETFPDAEPASRRPVFDIED